MDESAFTALVSRHGPVVLSVCRRVLREGVRAQDPVILIVDGTNKENYYRTIEKIPLPLGLQWSFEDHGACQSVLVETVSRFKGLERAIVLLWIPEPCNPQTLSELLYVGTSRAKSLLKVVGTEAGCAWIDTNT